MKVEVYGFAGCPSCAAVKEFLDDVEVRFEFVEINDPEARQRFYDELGLVEPLRRMPQVFIVEDDGRRERIGGFEKALASGIGARYRKAMAAQAAVAG